MSKSPCKNNIMYVVVESAAIEEVFMSIAKRLHEDRSSYPRTLITAGHHTQIAPVFTYSLKTFLGSIPLNLLVLLIFQDSGWLTCT